MKAFNKTSIGFCHIKEGKPCQDFSDVYRDDLRVIVTACDGHGGKIYIRSERGSRFASRAVINVLSRVDVASLEQKDEGFLNRIKFEILCEWNKMVERDLASDPFAEERFTELSAEDRFALEANPVRAYGTTLQGVMNIGDRLLCVGIGDGGVFAVKDGEVYSVFGTDDSEDVVANITYSMCQENAFSYLNAVVVNADDVDAVFVCTDGVVNPYRNVKGFAEYLVAPVLNSLSMGEEEEVATFVERLGSQIGIGDDVSLSVLYQDKGIVSSSDDTMEG